MKTINLRNILLGITTITATLIMSCAKSTTSDRQYAETCNVDSLVEALVRNYDPSVSDENAAANICKLTQAIIVGDAEALAEVTEFPIYRAYPDKDIENGEVLKQYFDILFDDSIKTVLRNTTIDDWHVMGYKGIMLFNGIYLWTNLQGELSAVNYESDNYRLFLEDLFKQR